MKDYCTNGIVAAFPELNQRTSEGLEESLIKIKTALSDFEKETGKKAIKQDSNLGEAVFITLH